ncbi:MAG: class I SAM-dependent methyltransferase [Candidatus Aenigmatarchaeota archaeon]
MRISQTNKYLPESRGRILDLGCGSGYLLKHVDFKDKYGIDIDLPRDSRCMKGDIRKGLPFKQDYFDCITMLAVFEHIEEDTIVDVMKECRRVLRSGGRLIITTPTPIANFIIQFLGSLQLVSKKGAEEHKKTYYRSEIMDILAEAGFDRNKIRAKYFELFMNCIIYADK